MSFQTPITVKEAVENVHAKRYLLPAIQRELVWSTYQIERLFDSLMRDYPVGSFLFWHVDKRKSGEFQFYEFIRDYHERDRSHNPKAHLTGSDDVTAILDGQQRLTALYTGLRGSYAYKERMKRWTSDSAFPVRRLHLNLLKPFENEEEDELDLRYDFLFMSDYEVREMTDDDHFWFRVGDVLDFKKHSEVNNFFVKQGLSRLDEHKAEFANETLFKLYSVVHEERVINFFLERGEELDKVLNIFVRVNSGGTPLSHSDLLLSIASASWQDRDAREEITGFVDEINNVGDGFAFNKDLVLKTCLVLCDFPDIAFKVDNFNRRNMLAIEAQWDEITAALRLAVTLAASYGYSRETLASNYALIPVAYYLLKQGAPPNFIHSSRFGQDRERIRKWLIASTIKRTFSGTPDNVLRPVRQVIGKHHDEFPLERIVDELRGKPKSLAFTEDDIDALFDYRYGVPYTFSTLAVLYPTFDFRNKFHVDHIHPKSGFTRRKLLKGGVPESAIQFYEQNFDYLANLQLLEGQQNIEKTNKDFDVWLRETHSDEQARRDYIARHYIPDIDPRLGNFEQFIAERTRLMKERFAELLKP